MVCIGYAGYHNEKTFLVRQLLSSFPRLNASANPPLESRELRPSKGDALAPVYCQTVALESGWAGTNATTRDSSTMAKPA